LYLKKDFDALNNHISNLLANSNEGKSYELYMLYATLSRITADKHIELMHSVLNEWCQKNPNSHIPWLVRGNFYIDWAWNIRGGGWAKDVSESAGLKFQEKLRLAEKDLEYARKLNPQDPNSYCSLIQTAKGLGYDNTIEEKIFQDGINVCPWHYGLYNQRFDSITPRWGGSYEEMMRFAEHCHELSKQYPTLGIILAHAYLEIHKYNNPQNENILGRDDIWSNIEIIFNAVFEKYPEDTVRNFQYAYYAYKAKQFDIAQKQFEIIGDHWIDDTKWSDLESYNRARGFTYYKNGENLLWLKGMYEMAIDYFQLSNRYNPTGNAYYGLGVAYERVAYNKRDVTLLKKAKESYELALKIEPDHKLAKDALNKLK
jgi:tetratricopeptide (TPR) repeat protein